MDCRTGLVLCLGLLVPLSGCVRPIRDKGEVAPEAALAEVIKKPETYVSFGDFRAAASFSPKTPAETQQIYREDARLSYLKAIALAPTYVPAYLALARLQQGSKDMTAALATYQQALQVTAKDAMLWYELGMCQARQKLFAESIASFQKACELSPSNKTYQTTMGYALARAERWSESLTALTGLVGEARAHYDLARMLHHMKQPDMARQYLVAALNRDPNMTEARDLFVTLGGTPPEPIQTAAFTTTQAVPAPVVHQVADTQPKTATVTAINDPASPAGIRLPPKPIISIRSGDH